LCALAITSASVRQVSRSSADSFWCQSNAGIEVYGRAVMAGRRRMGSFNSALTGAVSTFRYFRRRSNCGYHHSCDDKHELNRDQHQQITHYGSSIWPHSTNALHWPAFLQAGGQNAAAGGAAPCRDGSRRRRQMKSGLKESPTGEGGAS
jgi:hypothetical protein